MRAAGQYIKVIEPGGSRGIEPGGSCGIEPGKNRSIEPGGSRGVEPGGSRGVEPGKSPCDAPGKSHRVEVGLGTAGFRLLAITPERKVPGERALIRRLFESGLSCLHLRKPGMDADRLHAYLDYFTQAELSRIRVHGTAFSLLERGIAGLHLPFSALKECRLPGASISTSIHSWQEYSNLGNEIEYVLISPVYDSLSKPGYLQNKHTWDLPPVQHIPVIALGGIHGGNIAGLLQGGFSGAAILGGLWQQPEKCVGAFIKIKKQIASLLHDNEK